MMRLLTALILTCCAACATADVHTVQMLNRNEAGSMVFDPPYLNIAPGDTVQFLATARGHNAAAIEGLVPEGATTFKGQINEELTLTLDIEGLYGVKCTPHFAMGMVMLIEVGPQVAEPQDLPADLPRRAADRLHSYLSARN